MKDYIEKNIKVIKTLSNSDNIEKFNLICNTICNSFKLNGKLIIIGNGGSASDSMHIVGEFVSRFKMERKALNAISLVSNQALITAISNDYSFEEVFSRQLEAIANPNDILICLSTSGKSKNILKAAKTAKELGLIIISITGINNFIESTIEYKVESNETDIIQNCYMIFLHKVCEECERRIKSENRN